jgi:hypothetical protein
MDEQTEFDGKRSRRLRGWGATLRIWLTKAILGIGALYRFKSNFINFPLALLCLGCAFLGAACAHNDDSSADHAQHRQHHRGNYGQEQGGGFDRSGASPSSSPIPGL